ncbi:MAG: succinate dehydrogenase/fumarate reductase iron-sulfur subunit [Anaerolineae bacterium]
MSDNKWNITLKIHRQKEGQAPYFQEFRLEVDPDEYVLDAVERVWAFMDRSLCFRHACHHSTCGACGMRVNNLEKLTCITSIRDVTHDSGIIKVEPLRNFPVISDLVVDMSSLYTRMESVGAKAVLPVTQAEIERPPAAWPAGSEEYLRLTDCIECGLCISACPSAATSPSYLGPAVLAAAQTVGLTAETLEIVDSEDGLWRCHSAFECTAVCPSAVDPARRIMNLRQQVVRLRLSNLLKKN